MKKLTLTLMIITGILNARMVDVWVERGPKSVYTAGELLRVHVISKVDGYLYLYNIDPTGRVKLIFPLRNPVYIHAGVHYVLPDDFYYDIEWECSYEPGIEYIYAIVVPYPIYDMPDEPFEPLLPHEYVYYDYDDIEFAIVFRFRPPFWFPRIYFGAWTSYYVIPRYYVYHPAPWYCYDCHHPRVFISFYFDFCPLYEIRVYEYRYVYVPRYIKYVPRRYRVRSVWRFEKYVSAEKRIRLRKIENETRIRLREKGIIEGKPVREIMKAKPLRDVKVERSIRKTETRKYEKIEKKPLKSRIRKEKKIYRKYENPEIKKKEGKIKKTESGYRNEKSLKIRKKSETKPISSLRVRKIERKLKKNFSFSENKIRTRGKKR